MKVSAAMRYDDTWGNEPAVDPVCGVQVLVPNLHHYCYIIERADGTAFVTVALTRRELTQQFRKPRDRTLSALALRLAEEAGREALIIDDIARTLEGAGGV